ncbi:M48 family metallopeptidase [candidate division WOR-3 bacterium]|nr:M48 family metallopeptidase [candidate division WOR-3 bacterium]
MKKNADKIPAFLCNKIDESKLISIAEYSGIKIKFNCFQSLISTAVIMLFLFTPLYSSFINLLCNMQVHFIIKGLSMFILPVITLTIILLPFDYYFNFHIEEKFGFNKYTKFKWFMDAVKSFIVGLFTIVIILLPILLLFGEHFVFNWIFEFIIWGIISLLMIMFLYISPVLLLPFFFKLKPIDNEDLKNAITKLVQKSGYQIEGIYIADASSKSSHVNALFTGLFNKKKIILFDTLIDNYSHDEILAVLAHEIGHGKKKHIIKFLIISILLSLIFIISCSYIIDLGIIYDAFEIPNVLWASLHLIMIFFLDVLLFFLMPVINFISHKNEFESDNYSFELIGNSNGLISIFEKLITKELSQIHNHSIYDIFHHSHPTLAKRIKNLAKE